MYTHSFVNNTKKKKRRKEWLRCAWMLRIITVIALTPITITHHPMHNDIINSPKNESLKLAYRFSRKSISKLANTPAHRTPRPWFPVSYYAGKLSMCERACLNPVGGHYMRWPRTRIGTLLLSYMQHTHISLHDICKLGDACFSSLIT